MEEEMNEMGQNTNQVLNDVIEVQGDSNPKNQENRGKMNNRRPKQKVEGNYLTGKAIGILLIVLVIATTTLYVVKSGKKIWDNIDNNFVENHIDDIVKSNYYLYMNIGSERNDEVWEPSEVYLSRANLEKKDSKTENSEEVESDKTNKADTNEGPQAVGETESYDDIVEEDYYEEPEEVEWINHTIYSSQYFYEANNMQMAIRDDENGQMYQSNPKIKRMLTENAELPDLYRFYYVIQFDKKGNSTILKSYGLDKELLQHAVDSNTLTKIRSEAISYNGNGTDIEIKEPTNITIAVGIPKQIVNGYGQFSYLISDFMIEGGFLFVLIAAALIILLSTIILFAIPFFRFGTGILSNMPLELTGTGIILMIFATPFLVFISVYYSSGYIMDNFLEQGIPFRVVSIINDIIGYGSYAAYMSVLVILLVGVFQLFRKGFKRFFKENILVIRFLLWCKRLVSRVFRAVLNFDYDDNINKKVFQILAINFILLSVMCSIWFFGIPVLILYSIVLFFILRAYLIDLKGKYNVILKATKSMAEGNLDATIEEEVGVFEPLKQELQKVQYGFSRAVKEEVKSQNMRTELITNVSHDLKTPLTAIITYVNLLRDENITKEQRENYIDTLDRKSMRLKQLIEDLFEVSKINSNNIELDIVDVSIGDLIKQVHLELEDRLIEAEIEFRMNLPEEKIILPLDSQKTYRIFENLMVNISKYALPHTRAYLDLTQTQTEVKIVLKNISSTELNCSEEELTERFTRGDKSRNTEGSGLGLAIVKSLVEAQDGKLTILIDGDLFKVVIEFPKKQVQINEEAESVTGTVE